MDGFSKNENFELVLTFEPDIYVAVIRGFLLHRNLESKPRKNHSQASRISLTSHPENLKSPKFLLLQSIKI